MTDQLAKAYINMKGVLRALTYLCDLDPEAGKLIRGADVTVQFSVKQGPKARLVFQNGKCTFQEGEGKSNIKLWFSSPEKFNSMMEGKGNPTILKGFTKLGFLLKTFTGLTKRLEYYMKPGADTLQDDAFKTINTLLTFYTAFNALPEIGMHDPIGRIIMQKGGNGQLCVSIEDTDHHVRLKVAKGQINTLDASDGTPEMHLVFSSLEKTNDVLNGKRDFITAIGYGDVKVRGFIPVMMSVEHLVPRLASYLK